MASVSSQDVVNVFKEVYGDLQNILPQDQRLEQDIPFSEKQKVGEKFKEAIVLSHETGITLGGTEGDVIELNPAIAGAVKQVEVQPYMSVLASVIPWQVISRSAGGGQKSFYDATKFVVKNNLKSHSKFLEIFRFYGQADYGLGTPSYATATYRGASFTNGSGDLAYNGTTYTFTNGINAANKLLLMQPGQFASGMYVGMEGVQLQQVLRSSGAVVAEGKLVGVDAENGIIEVDFTPVAASAEFSHKIVYKGMAGLKEYKGVQNILSETGSLFGVQTGDYSLWKGTTQALGQVKLTLGRMQDGIAAAVNRGGLEGDIDCYVNPRTWATLVTTESGSREYDKSYKSSMAENGFEDIRFYHQTGKLTIKAHRCVKEGDCFGLHLPDWSRSGSAEVSFKVPGMDKEIIFPLENSTGYAFRSYSDQYVFNHAPARSLYWSGINDESST